MTPIAPTLRRAAPADPALRLRLERMLSGASLEPEGMPPAAILVVRSVSDPAPGRLRARMGDVRPPGEWERAVRGALRDRLHHAARPSRGVVPDEASAVLFADQAELLAVFARDAVHGQAGARWWWTALARGLGGTVDALAALWLREPRHVPAAVEHLAAWGEAERVMASLAPAQAMRILAAVAHAFDASRLLAAPSPIVFREMETAGPGDDSRGVSISSSPDVVATTLTTIDDAGRVEPGPPWEMVLGRETVPRTLSAEARALLGVSLALHRAPLIARTPGFAARFARWRALAVAAARAPSTAPEPSTTARSVVDADAPPSSVDATASPSTVAQAAGETVDARSAVPPSKDEATGRKGEIEGERIASSESPAVASPDAVVETARAAKPSTEASPSPETAAPWDAPLVREVGSAIEAAETMSGACGVFFLVNVVRSLGFFRALDEHFRLPSVVGGWGWIELLARALLGPRAAGLAHDPVWRLLAGLDGREPEMPAGMGFIAPAVDVLPERWAVLLRDAGAAWPDPSPPLGIDPSPALRRFLDLVVPFVRLRLEATLRAAGAEDGLETALFRRVGLVQVTRSHVDVRMELDQVSVPVRMAGLDATPGWVPELARVVTFHFA